MLNVKRGGGVLLAVHKNFSATIINTNRVSDSFKDVDILGLCVNVKFFKLIIILIYIPPYFLAYDDLFAILISLPCLNNDSNKMIIGDFNIPEYSSCSNISDLVCSAKIQAVNSFTKYYNLSQVNNVKNQNGRLLDLVFSSSNLCYVTRSDEPIMPLDLHHPALHVEYPLHIPKIKHFRLKETFTYNFKRANFQKLYQLLCDSDWSFLNDISNPNEAVLALYQYFDIIFNETLPKTIFKQSKYPPWFTGEIVRLLKMKKLFWRKYKRSKKTCDYISFKNVRKTVKYLVNTSYTTYLAKLELKFKTNPQSFWSYINYRKSNGSLPSTMYYHDRELKDPKHIVDAFANLFKESFIKSSHYTPTSDPGNNCYFSLPKITPVATEAACKKLKAKFTAGPDCIPSFIVRDCASAFAKPLTIIFNLCTQSCLYPDLWKKSKICPVFKKDDKNKIENYRPIALLSNFSKVFESVLHNQLSFYVTSQIVDQQHGFTSGKSTVTNLCMVAQYISENIDSNIQVDVVYTDFSKAFDRLDHGILLSKLPSFGFDDRLVKFIQDYLSDRSQYVQYRGYRSSDFTATSGVPQGSILGPLFFNIFINDITLKLTNSCLLYEDDLKIMRSVKSPEDCIEEERLSGMTTASAEFLLIGLITLRT